MVMLNKVIKVLLIIILVVVLIELCIMVYADYINIDAAKTYYDNLEYIFNEKIK